MPGGVPVLRLRSDAGGWLTVHSTRDPEREAQRQLATVAPAPPAALVVIGAGLGYLPEAALSRWPDAMVVVVEPLAAVAEAARARCPRLYADRRVRLLVGPAYDGADDLWAVFDAAGVADGPPPMLVHPVMGRAIPERMTEAARVVARAVTAARMNARARTLNAGRYLVNTLCNVRHVVAGANVDRLRAAFSGIPAIVIGAGPSLDRQIAALRLASTRALLIATDTAWRPLVHAGIDPHLVVSLDPSDENGRHLAGLARHPGTWVIVEGSVAPAALADHARRVAVFRVAAHHPWPWLARLGFDVPHLRAWGSVLTSAFDLAIACGCGPIVFVGADLAFTDGRPYCRGTTGEDAWGRHAARGVSLTEIWRQTLEARPLVDVPDVAGVPATTAPHLVEFRDWLVARAGEVAPGRVVNATGAGILVGSSVQQADLDAVLAGLPDLGRTVEMTITDRLHPGAADRSCGALRDALEAIAAAPSPTGETNEWLEFGHPGLTADDVAAAARLALAGLDDRDASSPTADPGPRLRWHAADRVAAARARLTGDLSVLAGCTPLLRPALRHDPAEVVAEATRIVAAIQALPSVASGLGEDLAAGASAETVPLSVRYAWTAVAAPWVARLEELSLDAEAYAGHAEPPAGRDAGFWSAPIAPVEVASASDDDVRTGDVEAQARLAVAIDALSIMAPASALDPRAPAIVNRVHAAARRALARPGMLAVTSPPVLVELPGVRGPLALPLRIDAFMRASTGLLAVASSTGDARRALLSAAVDYLEPMILTERGLAPGWSVATGGQTHAIFTPRNASTSVRINPDGTSAPATAWPGPITGELPEWNGTRGELAWHAPSAVLYWRSADTAPVQSIAVPFRPTHVALQHDGSTWWTDVSGGLWAWTPSTGARHVAALPAPGIPRWDDRALVVAPCPRDAGGRAVRRPLTFEWLVDPATGACREVPARIEGQCAKVARGGQWTAWSHPCSDLVRLEHEDGRCLHLGCHAPLGLAWTGTSLVVTTSLGEVVLFPALRDRLEALGTRTARHATGAFVPPDRHI